MTTPKLKESEYLVAWAIFFVCALVGGGVVGFILGAIAGVILAAVGVSIETIPIITGILGFLISLPISYLCFRFVVGKFVVEKLETRLLLPSEFDQPTPPLLG